MLKLNMVESYLIRISILIIFLLLVFFGLRYLERKSLYFPLSKIEATPEDIGLAFENVSFITEDRVQLSGWFIPAKSSLTTLIFCHGNGGNISHRLEKIKIFNDLNIDVLIFDYRGYGMSRGSPSEKGLYLDAEAVYRYLVKEKRIPPKKIIAYGESLGGSVAVDLASRHELAGVIIEGGFTSVKDMARRILPFIPTFIYKNKFDSLEKIKDIKSPKLIFHSVEDEIVPFELGKKLFDAAAEPKEFVELLGGHNDTFLVSQDIFITKMDLFISGMEE